MPDSPEDSNGVDNLKDPTTESATPPVTLKSSQKAN
jgi:hypothetical protein